MESVWLTTGEAFMRTADTADPDVRIRMTEQEARVIVRTNNGTLRRVEVASGCTELLRAMHPDDREQILRDVAELAGRIIRARNGASEGPGSRETGEHSLLRVTMLKAGLTEKTVVMRARAMAGTFDQYEVAETYLFGNALMTDGPVNRYCTCGVTREFLTMLIESIAKAARTLREEMPEKTEAALQPVTA